jgi:hypothetical protein
MPHLVWLTVSEYGAADSEMIGDKKTSCWIWDLCLLIRKYACDQNREDFIKSPKAEEPDTLLKSVSYLVFAT